MTAINTRGITRQAFLAAARRIVRAQLGIVVETATTKAKIAQIKEASAARTDALGDQIDEEMATALVWLMAHKDDFTERSKKTEESGAVKFGFRLCSNVVVEDEKAVLEWARANGYTDVVVEPQPSPPPKVSVSLPALRARISAGETVPGAKISSDYEPFVEPTPDLKKRVASGEPIGRL